MSQRPLTIDLKFSDLPAASRERHEALVDIFGQYLVWLRSWVMEASSELVESQEARTRLGAIRSRRYDPVASLDSDQRRAACKFAEATLDHFIQLFLTMLSGTGVDQRLGNDHAIRFVLAMEILNVQNEAVVEQEVINRGGEKFFADYWGRWLNRTQKEYNGLSSSGEANTQNSDNDSR